MKKLNLLIAIAFSVLLFSCTDEEVKPESASIELNFNNEVDGSALVLDKNYVNANGDTYSVESLKYYISNVTLTKTDGSTYAIPNSYYLIDNISEKVSLSSIPTGSYSKITFSIGVDNTANHSTAQTGDLDPNNDMAWSWDTGYKFLLFEGRYTSKNQKEGTFTFHVGKDANYKTLNFDKSVTLADGSTTSYDFTANIQEIFKNPTSIDLETTNVSHGENGAVIANNYASGFLTIK